MLHRLNTQVMIKDSVWFAHAHDLAIHGRLMLSINMRCSHIHVTPQLHVVITGPCLLRV